MSFAVLGVFVRRILRTLGGVEARRRWRNLILRRLGLQRCYTPPVLIARPELALRSYLGFLVAHELLRNPDFTFMQIGAYDGKLDDDLHELISTHRLRGVLVEPQAEAFDQLTETYRGHSQVTLVNAAIAERECVRILHCPRGDAALAASFDRQHVLRHGVSPKHIVEQPVVCYTVEGVLDRTGLDHVDLLQIDAEGYDDRIIESIDFSRLCPTIIRFEYRHLSALRADACIELLAQEGFRFLVEERDIMAWREDGRHDGRSFWRNHLELTHDDVADPPRPLGSRSWKTNPSDPFERHRPVHRFGRPA